MIALSIRQPWAWLIVNGYKDIENRSWPTKFRGRILVHAGKGMTRDEYEECRDWALEVDRAIPFPSFDALQRGGVVGACDITGCVADSPSPWFVGEYGFKIANARPLPFRECKGALSFFNIDVHPDYDCAPAAHGVLAVPQ